MFDSRSGETANSEQRTGERSVKAAFDALVRQLVMPEDFALKLKALSLVGDLSEQIIANSEQGADDNEQGADDREQGIANRYETKS